MKRDHISWSLARRSGSGSSSLSSCPFLIHRQTKTACNLWCTPTSSTHRKNTHYLQLSWGRIKDSVIHCSLCHVNHWSTFVLVKKLKNCFSEQIVVSLLLLSCSSILSTLFHLFMHVLQNSLLHLPVPFSRCISPALTVSHHVAANHHHLAVPPTMTVE